MVFYPDKVDKYNFDVKWSEDIALHNFTQIPNILLSCQGHLKLKDGELLTLIHLLTFQFSSESRVYPSITTLTKFSHKGYSTVQRRLRILEEKGYVRRRHRFGTSNTYDLKPCVEKLDNHSRTCATTSVFDKKRGNYATKVIGLPPSFLINKEYETLNIPTKEHPANLEPRTTGNLNGFGSMT